MSILDTCYYYMKYLIDLAFTYKYFHMSYIYKAHQIALYILDYINKK